jgi:hypothetical protein
MGYCQDHGHYSLYCRTCDAEVLNVEEDFKPEIEHITAVAIDIDGSIFSSNLDAKIRHYQLLSNLLEDCIVTHITKMSFGFLSSTGKFVNRVDALAIASKANQLIRKIDPKDHLFSEDLF